MGWSSTLEDIVQRLEDSLRESAAGEQAAAQDDPQLYERLHRLRSQLSIVVQQAEHLWSEVRDTLDGLPAAADLEEKNRQLREEKKRLQKEFDQLQKEAERLRKANESQHPVPPAAVRLAARIERLVAEKRELKDKLLRATGRVKLQTEEE